MNDHPSASATVHSAPPPYVPMSGAAITALVLAIVLLFASVIGPPWCEALALLVAVLALRAISKGVRRGKGVAITAIGLALGGGTFGFWSHRESAKAIGGAFSPVVRALEKGDRAALSKWLGDGAAQDAKFERWSARSKAARAAVGELAADLTVPILPWGVWIGAASRPDYHEEFEPKGKDAPISGATFWFRAPCANGDVFVAFDFGTKANFVDALTKARSEASDAAPGTTPAMTIDTMFAGKVEEVRYFR